MAARLVNRLNKQASAYNLRAFVFCIYFKCYAVGIIKLRHTTYEYMNI